MWFDFQVLRDSSYQFADNRVTNFGSFFPGHPIMMLSFRALGISEEEYWPKKMRAESFKPFHSAGDDCVFCLLRLGSSKPGKLQFLTIQRILFR